MIFKEDWEESKKRFEAFWEGEIIDRCCIAVTAPRKKPIDSKIELQNARDLVQKWTDPEYRINEFILNASKTFYGGEAFPNFWVNLGPGVMASFIGADYKLAQNTVWFDTNPIIKDWSCMPDIKFDENSSMWKIYMDLLDSELKNLGDKGFVGITDLGGNLDIAASLRSTEALLYDLIDYSEEVKSLIEKIDTIWFQCYEKSYEKTKKVLEGTSAWMSLWCRERWYPLQCDFSAMISPDMFEEFVKPSLARETEFLDKSIYHWDGPGQIPHLDHLLDLENLTGIQWTPGSGNPNVCDEKWYPLYKKIQAKRKNLVLLGAYPQNIEKLLDNISPKGVFITTYCKTEDEARELLKRVERK